MRKISITAKEAIKTVRMNLGTQRANIEADVLHSFAMQVGRDEFELQKFSVPFSLSFLAFPLS